MRSNPNRYWGEVGGRIVWSKGTKAYVAYPETDKWITIPLRQLLQQGTGYETLKTSYLGENHKMVTETKTIRELIRGIKSS